MPKVICSLPNASTKINGVNFISHKLGMISEEIDDAVAKQFLEVRGYLLHGAPVPAAETGGTTDPAALAILAAADRTAAEASARAKAGPSTQAPASTPTTSAPATPVAGAETTASADTPTF